MKYARPQPKKKEVETYPTPYGSHKSMLSEDHQAFNEAGDDVICKDERGLYVTLRKTLDNGICDRCRIAPDFQREASIGEILRYTN